MLIISAPGPLYSEHNVEMLTAHALPKRLDTSANQSCRPTQKASWVGISTRPLCF